MTKDQAAVKLDDSHYFFSVRAPKECDDDDDLGDMLNYGLSFALKGQEDVTENLDKVLESYCSFSKQKVKEKGEEVLDVSVAKELSPSDLEVEKNKEVMEKKCQAYWTTLAPNVEDMIIVVLRQNWLLLNQGSWLKGFYGVVM